jgi:formylglycine-generating enzyme required for sulfatase activity
MVLVNIPSGRAQLGPTSKEDEFDQSVERQINSDVEGFLISQTEVTQSQWNQLMDENPSVTLGDNLPVHRVTIEKAKEFARRLSRKEGRRYFLPNETQWEVACKSKQNNVFAGTDSRKSLAEFANYKTSGVKNMLHAVGTKKANPNTLFDMSGNVYEWVLTHKNYESPQDMSVIKGGSWNASFNASRCAHRAFVAISDFEIDIGFRVVTSID